MPTIPVYDAHEVADPGQLAPVQLDNSVAAAEGRTGAAIEGIGGAITNLAEHFQKREEQKQNFAASIGLQSLHESIIAGDAKAQNQMPIDGNGWAASRQTNTQAAVTQYVQSLPENLRETYGAKAGLLAQKQRDLYAQQEVAQQGQYYTGVVTQQAQKTANGLYADPSLESYNAARETLAHQIDNLPVAPDQKLALHQKLEQDLALASITGTAKAPAIAAAQQKLGVVGPGGTYTTPPAGQGPTLEDGRRDMTGQFNTTLAPADEAKFQTWLKENHREGDLSDYDLRGWFKSNGSQADNGHFTDQFKKPNHPTFSDQSQYSGKDGAPVGGHWAGDDKAPTFTPSEANLKNMSPQALQEYFKRVEPDSKLLAGQQASAQGNERPQAAVLRSGDAGGADNNYFSRIRAIESGGRNIPASPGHSATGVYQFLPSTWAQVMRQHPELDLTQADINNPQKQELAIRAFTGENAASLTKVLGREPTGAELYLAHQQGASGAAKLLSNPDAPAASLVGTKAVISNGGNQGMTAAQFVNLWQNKYNGTKGVGTPGASNSDPGGHYGLDPNDPRLAAIPWQQRRAVEMDAMRNAETFQAQQNSAMQQQHADFMNTTQLAANDGKYGLADLEKDRQRGAITQYGDVSKLQSIIASKQENNDALSEFSMKLADPHAVFNPVDKDDMKAVDAGYAALTKGGVNPADAAQRVIERTGIVPSETTTALRGAMVSGDAGRAQGALTATSNILRVNPNILDTLPGGEKLAKQANTFNHYTSDMGMTAADATKRIVDEETPEYKRKIAVMLKDQDINQVIKQNLSVGDVDNALGTGGFFSSGVGNSAYETKTAVTGDYQDWFKIHYMENGDIELSKKLAAVDLKNTWGTTNVTGSPVITRYPIEKAPAYAGVPDVGDRVAEAAQAMIKEGTGQDVPRDKIILQTSPGVSGELSTADAWKAGKAPPMVVHWMDANGHQQIAPHTLTVDPGVMRFKQSLNRQQQFEAARASRQKVSGEEVNNLPYQDEHQ